MSIIKEENYTMDEYDGIETYRVDSNSVREWEKNLELEKKIQKLEDEKRILRNEIDRFIDRFISNKENTEN